VASEDNVAQAEPREVDSAQVVLREVERLLPRLCLLDLGNDLHTRELWSGTMHVR
jgi:hypothetical protein